MTREQLQAHMKLREILTVRTHYAPSDKTDGKACRLGRAVIVQGKRYETMGAAGRALGKSRQKVSYMVRTGKAKYA